MATNLGELTVRIGADTTGLERGLRKTNTRLDSMRRGFTQTVRVASKFSAVVGAVAIAVGTTYVRASMKAIDSTAKFADMIGVGTEELVGLQYAAKITAGMMDNEFNMAIQRMTRRVAEAAQGTGEAKDAIKELGLDAQALDDMGVNEAFMEIADAMQGIENESQRVRMAFKLFDSEGAKLVNTLSQGSEEIRRLQREAEQLGIAFNRVDAARVEQANDALTAIGQVIKGIANRIAIELAPYIQGVAESLREWSVEAGGFRSTIEQVVSVSLQLIGKFADGIHMMRQAWAAMNYGVSLFGDAVVQSMRIAMEAVSSVVDTVIEGTNSIIRVLNNLPKVDIAEGMLMGESKFMDLVDTISEESRATALSARSDLEELMNREWPSEGIDKWLAEVKQRSDEAAKAIADAREGRTGDNENGNLPGEGDDGTGDALQKRLDQVREYLASEAELEQQRHSARQEALRQALENEMVTRQEYQEMEAELNQKHAERMRELEIGQSEEKLERLREFLQTEREAEIAAHEERLEWLAEAREKELIGLDEFNTKKQELQRKHEQNLKEIVNKGERDRMMLRRMWLGEDVKMTGENMSKAVGEVQQGMQAMFAQTKIGAIASGILKRLQSILNAYEWGSAIGGPPLGAAAAATAAATTMATLSQLKSTQYGSKGTGGGGTSGGSSMSATQTSAPQQQQQQTQRIMIDGLGDDAIMSGRQVRKLIDDINEAQQDGTRLLVV